MSHYSPPLSQLHRLLQYLLSSSACQILPSEQRSRILQKVATWSEDERRWFASAPKNRAMLFALWKEELPESVPEIMVSYQNRYCVSADTAYSWRLISLQQLA